MLPLAAVLGCQPRTGVAPADDTAITTVDQLSRRYKELALVTKEPVLVNPELAMLCIRVSQFHVDALRAASGPHTNTAIRIYMNDSALMAFRNRTTPYPVGSVIVKEKLAQGIADGEQHDGVGGMIKRAAGFDPSNGDWEYFYAAGGSQVDSGPLQSCVNCHRKAAPSDFVFGAWASQ